LTPAPTPTPSELLEEALATATAEAAPTATPTEVPTETPVPTSTPSATATPVPSPTVPPPFVDRRVQAGETLSQIAAEYGMSAGVIATANGLAVDGVLPTGQMLAIPRTAGVVYTVGPGEFLSEIADRYGVNMGTIIEANGIEDASLVFAGQRLLIPGARPMAPTAAPTRAPTMTPVPPTRTAAPTATLAPTRVAAPTAAPTAGATADSGRPAIGRGGPNAPLRWPAVANLSQLFGENGHSGIDIMAGYGATVAAARDGLVVSVADSDFGYGKHVEIDHGGGLTTLYGHLSAFTVTAGQRVTPGQRIGSVGDSGYSFGPHLHFEVRLAGVPVDPLAYLP
jgi:murein DD-endopeptidase MepM/ murein hydrolase activator NlpD